MCCVCEAEEETATIQLDVSRVVVPLADDGRGAETHHVAYCIFTIILYAVGIYYVLGVDTLRPEFPTLWSGPYQCPQYVPSIIRTETIEPRSGKSTGQTAYDAAPVFFIVVVIVFIDVWSWRFEQNKMSRQLQDAEHDVEIWSRRIEQNNISKQLQDTEDDHEQCLGTADEH